MDATPDILQGKWSKLKGQVKQRRGRLTDEDVQGLSGKTAELVDVLRQRCGYGEAQAVIEINRWLSDSDTALA